MGTTSAVLVGQALRDGSTETSGPAHLDELLDVLGLRFALQQSQS